MQLKHSILLGFMGQQYDRFHRYQPAKSFAERVAMAKQVKGAHGIEVVYPQDFADPTETIKVIQDSGMLVSAVNLNVKSEDKWRAGSFTATDPQLRADAVQNLKISMDLAAELNAGMVTCCPLIDGHNYNFEADYLKQWRWLQAGIAEAAQHRSDVKVSLEYKPSESRNYVILGDMGRTLYLCERLGLPHVGVTMDVGHALVAKETPAAMLCMAADAGRLFYVHLNDNGREWDWDMLPGAVNLWDLVEVVYYLNRLNWDGWLAYDVMTRNGDPIETMQAAIDIVNTAQALVEKIGCDTLQGFIDEGIPARAFSHLLRSFA
jgi:xylose isomerase